MKAISKIHAINDNIIRVTANPETKNIESVTVYVVKENASRENLEPALVLQGTEQCYDFINFIGKFIKDMKEEQVQ